MVKRYIAAAATTAVVAAGGLAGPVTSAGASNASIKAVITSYNGVITSDEGRVLTAIGTAESTGNAAPLHVALVAEERDLHALRSKVAAQRASSARGRAGKAKFLAGIGSIVKAYRKLDKGVSELKANPAAGRADIKRSLAIVKKGRAQLNAAVKLLG
jgi:hypothetical protein